MRVRRKGLGGRVNIQMAAAQPVARGAVGLKRPLPSSSTPGRLDVLFIKHTHTLKIRRFPGRISSFVLI